MDILKKTIDKILENYKAEVAELSGQDMDNFPNIERGIQISRKYLQELRIVVRNGEFKSKTDEIRFFKEQTALYLQSFKILYQALCFPYPETIG